MNLKSTRRKTHQVLKVSDNATALWRNQRDNVWLLPPLTIDDLEANYRGMPATIVEYNRFDGRGNLDRLYVRSIHPLETIPATVTDKHEHGADFSVLREDGINPDDRIDFIFASHSGRVYLRFSPSVGPTSQVLDHQPAFVGMYPIFCLFIGERIHEPGKLIAKSGAFASWPPVGEPEHF